MVQPHFKKPCKRLAEAWQCFVCLTEPLCLNSSAGTSVPLWVAEWYPVGAVCSAGFGTCQGSVPRGERSRCPVADSWPHTRQNHGCRDPSCETPKRVSCCSSPRVSRGIYSMFTTQCYVNSGHFQIRKEHITCPWVNHCFSGLSHESICICHVLLHSKLLLNITVGYNKNPLCLMSAWVRHLGAPQLGHSHSCGPLALQLALRHWLSWGLPPACSLPHPVI